jgi:hypothetical protein
MRAGYNVPGSKGNNNLTVMSHQSSCETTPRAAGVLRVLLCRDARIHDGTVDRVAQQALASGVPEQLAQIRCRSMRRPERRVRRGGGPRRSRPERGGTRRTPALLRRHTRDSAPTENASRCACRPARRACPPFCRGIESYHCSTSAPTRLKMRARGGSAGCGCSTLRRCPATGSPASPLACAHGRSVAALRHC